MLKRVISALGASAVVCGGLAVAAGASTAATTPLPKAANGKKVSVVATGLGTPTSFAFGAGTVFEGDGGPQGPNGPTAPGGVFVLKGGKATVLAGSPPFVGGLVYSKGTLFVSAAYADATTHLPNKFQILAWSGWNGTAFTKHKAIYTAPKGFTGFNGLAVGPDGRLYVGVDVSLTQANDHGPATTPYLYDILAMDTKGKHLKVFASGLRQPWQIAFAPGSSSPFVTVLGQDKPPSSKAPDLLVRVTRGANFGFPQCNWATPKAKDCKGFTKPFQLFKPHSDIGGIGIIGKRIFISEFGFGSAPAGVVTVPLKGGKPKQFLSGFVSSGPAPTATIGLGVNNGWVYVGTTTGVVYRVHS
jgi:glucose/arabinose dehydrogenase